MDDETKDITLKSGIKVKWLERTVDCFLDLVTLIYGGTNCGKTTAILEILYILRQYIPMVILVAPKTSHKMYAGKIPKQCIFDELTKELFERIWERQEQLTLSVNDANTIENLEALYKLCPNRSRTDITLSELKRKTREAKEQINRDRTLNYAEKSTQSTNVDELFAKACKEQYKAVISANKQRLEKLTLTDSQKITLEFFDVNPKILIILDDVTEAIKPLMKSYKSNEINPVHSIFYRGRHNNITLILAVHDDKFMDSDLRKNARVSYYMEEKAINGYINKSANGISGSEKKMLSSVASEIFQNTTTGGRIIKNYQKMCYVKDLNEYRYFIANLYPEFNIGSRVLRKLCNSLPTAPRIPNPLVDRVLGKSKKKQAKPPAAAGKSKY